MYYRVAAVVEQSKQYGQVNQTGKFAYSDVYIGSSPVWTSKSPPNNSKFIARAHFLLSIPLEVFAPETDGSSIQFMAVEDFPSIAYLNPSIPIFDSKTKTVSQNITVQFSADLAGSEYLLCMYGEDMYGFRTEIRYFYLFLPKPEPRLISPENNSLYSANIGCDISILLIAEDRTSAGLDPYVAGMNGFTTGVALASVTSISRYRNSFSTSAPAGASLVMNQTANTTNSNPSSSVFTWRPVKGQEGFTYRYQYILGGFYSNMLILYDFELYKQCKSFELTLV